MVLALVRLHDSLGHEPDAVCLPGRCAGQPLDDVAHLVEAQVALSGRHIPRTVVAVAWTCPGFVESVYLTSRAFRSKATGLWKPSDEWRLTGL